MQGFDGPTIDVPFAGVTFRIDPAHPAKPANFILGVRKSGSSMFNRAVRMMTRFNRINWVDIAGDLFENNVAPPDWMDLHAPPDLLRGGNVYAGFREFPVTLARDVAYRDAIKVLLVRDPRDAIVSEYFSTRLTHSLPATGDDDDGARGDLLRRRKAASAVTIDEFAIAEVDRMARTLDRYVPVLSHSHLLLLRYEDVIFDKAQMIRDLAAHFVWTVRPPQVEQMLKWIDVRPEVEDPTAFIRKVTPAIIAKKLSAATIAQLNARLEKSMAAFGYE